MTFKQFSVNTEISFGENAMERLRRVKGKRVLIICDPFIQEFRMTDSVIDRLQGCSIHIFSKISPDPSLEIIAEGLEVIRSFRPNVLIAIGGGSAIDAAKAMREFAKRFSGKNGLDVSIEECYAIPTTSGTGSEVTKFSVLTDKAKGVKYPLVDDSLTPMYAILEPELVVTVPPHITADTGMDVITHAIEAYVSNDATDFTDALAEKAISLAFKFLPEAYRNGEDRLAREKMHNASCLAGIAFNNAGLGICHSLAHSIGARYHIPHGRANSIFLPHVVAYNAGLGNVIDDDYSVAARKYQRIAKIVGLKAGAVEEGVESLICCLKAFQGMFNMAQTFYQAGVDPADIAKCYGELAEAAKNDACTRTNPRHAGTRELSELLNRAAE